MVNINYRVAEYVSIPQANTLHYQYLTNDVLHTLFQLSKWQREAVPAHPTEAYYGQIICIYFRYCRLHTDQ